MCQSCKNKEELERYIRDAIRLRQREQKRAYRKRLKEKSITHRKKEMVTNSSTLDGENIK